MWLLSQLRHWLSLQGKVTREEYVLTGVGLMSLKYAVEAVAIYHFTGRSYSPLDFVNPLLSARSQFTVGAPEWLGFAWIVWTAPFVWIALTMSIRRSVDAGASPWAAMLVLAPLFNFALMLYLSIIPAGYANRVYKPRTSKKPDNARFVVNSTPEEAYEVKSAHSRQDQGMLGANAVLFGLVLGSGYMFGSALFCVYFLNSYGLALFYGTPIVAGAVTGYTYNRRVDQPTGKTLGLAIITCLLFSFAFLLIGLEGLICIAMAAPIVAPMGILGGLVGKALARIARQQHRQEADRGLLNCILLLPLFAAVEPHIASRPEFVVMSSVEIAASPEQVWNCVVDFPPIISPEPWYFRWGIASPREATIDGHGVGALRYCKFTTGEFVEPITVWDAPRRLAFDVTHQPEPMTELSPYRHIHPPHLDGSFRSTRGEFLLVELPNGNIRLEGRTWYTLDIRPLDYWTLWTDAIVHRIHLRVLEHIKEVAEEPQDRP